MSMLCSTLAVLLVITTILACRPRRSKLVRRPNKNPRPGSNPVHVWFEVEEENGDVVWLALPEGRLHDAKQLAQHNVEDEPK